MGSDPLFTFYVNGTGVAESTNTMPRKRRITLARYIYHVCNRGAKKARIFESAADYLAFERLLITARTRFRVRILAYALMPNHWHLLLWPSDDNGLPRFMQWLSSKHAGRWNRVKGNVGGGAVYQSRFKSIPIEGGSHLFLAWRYVERNPLRAQLVSRAEQWRWNSLWLRANGVDGFLDLGPTCLPDNWVELVNNPQTDVELEALRRALQKEQPYGSQEWVRASIPRRGRPPIYEKGKNGVRPQL
jgi:REP-associated tyrosine transposase